MSTATSQAPILTMQKRVCCDGGGGALGHPKVYFEFKAGQTHLACSYCGQVFERRIDPS